MKLYFHPVSTVSRPVMLFAADNGVELDTQVVDLMKGEHMQEAYGAINPSRLVPVLKDGDFRLTESSAILKYLADKIDSPAYPKDLQKRARVNEIMDWLNTGFYRDFGYGLVYPQVFPHHKRRSDEAHSGCIEWGKERTKFWLKVLDQQVLGSGNRYLCGDDITIADYLGSMMILGGEAIDCKFGAYPNVCRWLGNMKKLKSWHKVNEAFYKYVVDPNKGKEFVRL